MAAIQETHPTATVRQRIGDAERDQATECLREHMASGRLEPIEFEDRLERALTAHFQSDLDQLFVDLPAPHPQRAVQPQPEQPVAADSEQQTGCPTSQRSAGWNLTIALMWTAAIALCATVSWQLWWLMFIPLAMSGGVHKHRRRQLGGRHRQLRMGRPDHLQWH